MSPSTITKPTTKIDRKEEIIKDPLQLAEEGWIVKSPKTQKKQHHRKRNRALSIEQEVDDDHCPVRVQPNTSDAHLDTSTTRSTSIPGHSGDMIVVVVDNSNIFIGARETVCSAHAQEQIKPKHVKLRLQQLLNVAEQNRSVTRGFTAGSSPPTSEQVWEVYRLENCSKSKGTEQQNKETVIYYAKG